MATLKQIEANRANALRSTGPVTAAGKAAVRFNALKSGIDAASQIIPGEDPAELQTLADEFTQSWQPADARERELVDQLIDDAWRLKRLRRAEAQLWTASIESNRGHTWHRPHTEVGDAFADRADTLLRLQRFIAGLKRSYHQAAADLQRLQAARLKAVVDAQTEDVTAPLPEPPTEVLEQSQFEAIPLLDSPIGPSQTVDADQPLRRPLV